METKNLSIEQLNFLNEANFNSNELNEARDLFLFQCYTGRNYPEILLIDRIIGFTHFSLNDTDIVFINQDKSVLSSRLKEGALEIILKYVDAEKTKFEIPLLKKYNTFLKQIGNMCGIDEILIDSNLPRDIYMNTVLNLPGEKKETIDTFCNN